jgi:hypothetical protein
MRGNASAGALAAVIGMILLQALPAEAATPTNLGAILAQPPSLDYIEPMTTSSLYLEGAFDAHRFASWVTLIDRGDRSGFEPLLKSYQFTRGYARTWWLPGTDYLLEEFVFEFAGDSGASRWLAGERQGTSLMAEYRGPLAGGSDLPYAWTGRVSIEGPNGADRIAFANGNDEYEISFESGADDLTALALKQARAQYALAPARSVPPPASGGTTAPAGASFLPVLTAIRWIGLAVAALIAAMTGLALLLIAGRRV